MFLQAYHAGRQTTTGSLLKRSQAECGNALEVNGLLIKLAGYDRRSGSMVRGLNGRDVGGVVGQ